MAPSRSMPGRVMRMNQSAKRSAASPEAHDFLRCPLENGPDLRLEAALVADGALPEAFLGGVGSSLRTTMLAVHGPDLAVPWWR